MNKDKILTIRNTGIIAEIENLQEVSSCVEQGVDVVVLDYKNDETLKTIQEIKKQYSDVLVGLNVHSLKELEAANVDFVVSSDLKVLEHAQSNNVLAFANAHHDNIATYANYPVVLSENEPSEIKKDLAIENVIAVITKGDIKEAVDKMLGLKLTHIGLNFANEEEALSIAKVFELAFHMPYSVGNSSIFSGAKEFELMKKQGRGKNGHIAIVVSDVDRGIHYLTKRGFAFEEASLVTKNDVKIAIYLANEIAGFAFHLVRG